MSKTRMKALTNSTLGRRIAYRNWAARLLRRIVRAELLGSSRSYAARVTGPATLFFPKWRRIVRGLIFSSSAACRRLLCAYCRTFIITASLICRIEVPNGNVSVRVGLTSRGVTSSFKGVTGLWPPGTSLTPTGPLKFVNGFIVSSKNPLVSFTPAFLCAFWVPFSDGWKSLKFSNRGRISASEAWIEAVSYGY